MCLRGSIITVGAIANRCTARLCRRIHHGIPVTGKRFVVQGLGQHVCSHLGTSVSLTFPTWRSSRILNAFCSTCLGVRRSRAGSAGGAGESGLSSMTNPLSLPLIGLSQASRPLPALAGRLWCLTASDGGSRWSQRVVRCDRVSLSGLRTRKLFCDFGCVLKRVLLPRVSNVCAHVCLV